jgi:hypothetical protein
LPISGSGLPPAPVANWPVVGPSEKVFAGINAQPSRAPPAAIAVGTVPSKLTKAAAAATAVWAIGARVFMFIADPPRQRTIPRLRIIFRAGNDVGVTTAAAGWIMLSASQK